MRIGWTRSIRPRGRRRKRPPIRVAQICGAVDGALWMVQLAAGLRERGFDVVAVIGGAEGQTAARLRAAGVPYVVHPHAPFALGPIASRIAGLPLIRHLSAPLYGLELLREGVSMARLLRRLEVDVVHTHVIASILVGRIAAALARVPIRVAMVTGPYQLEAPGLRVADLATQWMDHRLLSGCAHTDRLYERAGVPARRRRIVSYGVDPGDFDPRTADRRRVREELEIPSGAPLIGQVAYFYPVTSGFFVPAILDGRGSKGHEDFIDAARLVADVRPDARFVLVGGGWGEAGERHRSDIESRARDAGLEDVVTFTGHRRDIADVLAALDVSVQCSLSENYGGTLESLLMEAPTVATRVGGMPEVVRHEETGLLVPPRDPPALAAAMLRLIEEREWARLLGARGRERVLGGYTVQHMIEGVVRCYDELARERLSPRALRNIDRA